MAHVLLLLVVTLLILKCESFVNTDEAIDFNLTFVDSQGRNITSKFFTTPEEFKKNNLTAEKFNSLLLHPNSDGVIEGAVIDGRYVKFIFDVAASLDTMVYAFGRKNGSLWFVSSSNFTNITVKNFDDDASLVPLSVDIEWSLPTKKNLSKFANISILSSVNSVSAEIDNFTLLSLSYEYDLTTALMIPWAGIQVMVLHEKTGHVIYNNSFNTQQPLIGKELESLLQALQSGRIVIMATLNDCSANLLNPLRLRFKELGSFDAPFIRVFDAWAWVWIVGGKSIGETMAIQDKRVKNNRLLLEVNIKLDTSHEENDCWPNKTTILWRKRKIFCAKYEGYGRLCSCQDPYIASPSVPLSTWKEDMVILVLAGTRSRYVHRLLQQLLEQPGINRSAILISIDGFAEETIRLVETFDLNYVVFKSVEEGQRRISRHLRFALFNSFRRYPNLDKFIVLEDDITLSPDFYSFMQQTSVLLDNDTSVYAVSAYSHLAFDHTARDIHKLYRAHTMPSYGWMVKRNFLEFVLPMWPPEYASSDWDFWMLSNLVRRNRELVFPEIPRTLHSGTTGTHFSGHLSYKFYFNKPFSNSPNATVDVPSVMEYPYEDEVMKLLKKSKLITNTDPYEIDFPKEALNTWRADKRDDHHGLWILPFYNTTLLIVGIPYSKYTKIVYKDGDQIIEATKKLEEIREESNRYYKFSMVRHEKDDFLQILGILEPKPKTFAIDDFEMAKR